MNDVGSTLIAHCGAHKVTREDLKTIPIPEGTKTHQPLSHYEIVEVLEEALSFRYLNVIRDEYAVSGDGMKMFGVMDLNTGFDGGNFSIGLRNSNDKSMRLALTAGLRVMVCDNMAFSGDFTPLLQKHTRKLELKDSISIAVDRIQRGFKPLEKRIAEMKQYGLTDNDARILIYGAFIDRGVKGMPRILMPQVHGNYFEPKEEEFAPRTLWSLSNAFTSAFKDLSPIKQFEVTAKLGTFMTEVQAHSLRISKEAVVETMDTVPRNVVDDEPHADQIPRHAESPDEARMTDYEAEALQHMQHNYYQEDDDGESDAETLQEYYRHAA